jgi:hypothetical protein
MIMSVQQPPPAVLRVVALVTSAGRILLVRRQSPQGAPFELPQLPPRPADAVRAVRRHLDGELIGLRQVALRRGGSPAVELRSARLVGHASGHWAWVPSPSEGADPETVEVVEVPVGVAELEPLDLQPAPVKELLLELLRQGRPLGLLLGARSSHG